MKKEYIFYIVGALLILLVSFILLNRNKVKSIITIDINPSIEIDLDKNNNIINVLSLKEDASIIISDNIKNKNLNDGIDIIIENTIHNLNIPDKLVILLHAEGNIKSKEVEELIINNLDSKGIQNDVITIEDVSSIDKEQAKKNNISPAKMAYINKILESNDKLSVNDLINKSISELNETNETGFYCENGYELRGNSCLKEISRVKAIDSKVCSNGYFEYNDKCYEERPGIETGKEYCEKEYELIDNVCIRTRIEDATAICESGFYNSKDGNCYENVYVGDAYEFCRDPGRTLYEHKCLATKPTINGGCLGKDKLYKGKCVNTRNDYYMAEWKCKNGQVLSNHDGSLINEDKKCYEEKSVGKATIKCENDGILNGKKCNYKDYDRVLKELKCPEGFSLVRNDRCINLKNTQDKVSGFACSDERSELRGSECISYDIVPAKH